MLEASNDPQGALFHADAHQRYRLDDSARDVAITQARARYPNAAVAAESVPVYPLNTIQHLGNEE